MRTKVKGYFDVRQYNDKKPREQWKLKGDDETIGFGFTTTEPGEFAEFARQYEAKDGATAYRVNFKIGGRCQWFGPDGRRIDRPTNAELEADRWECVIDYNVLHGAEGSKEARGYWVNAIQCKKVGRYEFAPMTDVDDVTPVAPTATATETATATGQPEQFGDLPF